ncbi:hypothetical protein RHSIM_Rhsim02G0190600 [Rhododendron simsii]|uniref:Uncharacterized protein n=1 Tax=Rhododendron simsii TaxID=118357 RepID=A0A834HFW3_RHOSS|nr:hypothetical protein RHSIM_Rhsim02G0190600 [Rhododendron simsii]
MGNKNTTTLINRTKETMEIREFRGIFVDENHFFSKITVEAGQQTDMDSTKYRRGDSQGGELSSLMIFCGGSLNLRSSKGDDLLLRGEDFIQFKTVTIVPAEAEDQNSTGVVNYEVEFKPRDASVVSAKSLKFWPRTFAYLKCNDDLGRTVRVVNDLMRQAKLYNVDRSKVEVAKVVEKVCVLKKLCAAKVEWYRPLFPGMENRFPPAGGGEVDQEKLQKFATAIEPLLRQPISNCLEAAAESHDQFS